MLSCNIDTDPLKEKDSRCNVCLSTDTKELLRMKNRLKDGFDYLSYGLWVFAVIGFELLQTYAVEYNLYKTDFKGYTPAQSIIHWVITCIAWGIGAYLIMKD